MVDQAEIEAAKTDGGGGSSNSAVNGSIACSLCSRINGRWVGSIGSLLVCGRYLQTVLDGSVRVRKEFIADYACSLDTAHQITYGVSICKVATTWSSSGPLTWLSRPSEQTEEGDCGDIVNGAELLSDLL